MLLFNKEVTLLAWKGLTLWLSFLLPHLVTALMVMHKDCSGRWDKWRLVSVDGSLPRWHKYWKCIPSVARNTLVLLPISLAIGIPFFNIHEQAADYSQGPAVMAKNLMLDLFKLPLAYTMGRVWAMVVHYILHINPQLYKAVHKAHHVPLRELCALSAFRDHPLEFLLMEVPGTFLLGPLLLRLQLPATALLLAYQGTSSAVDHSGFCVNRLVDSRYHFMHHVNPRVNYGEMELLDKLAGTFKGGTSDL